MKIAGAICWLLAVLVLPALAMSGPSVERGRELFDSTRLGTNGKSCSGCHQGGSGLAGTAGYSDERLGGIINQCIKKPLNGTPLAADSSDLKSLVMYLRTFAKPASK
jgi:mono/diheme cytochrome c family protein